jgi:hypothetical protein
MLALALAACGGGSAEPKTEPQAEPRPSATPSAEPSAAPSSAPAASGGGKATLEVLADGKPVEFPHVLATSEGGSAITLEFSNKPYVCRKPEGGRELPPDGWKSFEVKVAPKLAPDGSTSWAVLGSWYDNYTRQGEVGPAKVEGDATKGVTVELPATTVEGMEGRKLVVKGRVSAKGCGVVPSVSRNGLGDKDPEPKPVPQPGFTFSIAGKAKPIVSALLIKRKGVYEELKLSTAAAGCNVSFGGADIEHKINLDKKKQPTSTFLMGAILPSQMSGGFSTSNPAPKLTFGAEAKGSVPVTLSGEYTMSDYKLKVDGKLDVTVCDRK